MCTDVTKKRASKEPQPSLEVLFGVSTRKEVIHKSMQLAKMVATLAFIDHGDWIIRIDVRNTGKHVELALNR